MEHKPFVHLHTHSHYSILDGAIKIKDLVKYAASMKFPAIALTDHGNMCGAIEFYKTATENGVIPIIGIEFYITDSLRQKKRDEIYHLVLLAKNSEGYKNLIELTTKAYLEGFYYEPRIDKEILKKHSKGLIALSACINGEVAQHILKENFINAEKSAFEYKEIFDEDFYLEIQYHNLPEEKKVIKEMLKISKNLSIPLVATNDVHYLTKNDYEAHDILLCLQTQKKVDDPDRLRLKFNEFYLKSYEEMVSIFSEIPEALKNTIEITEKCTGYNLEFEKYKMPKFDIPENLSPDEYLEQLANEGLKKRFPDSYKEKLEQLNKELEIIKKMKLSEYFLIVQDIVSFARKNNIMIGPGRGSAAGSLLSYVLGITNIDPIKYGLFFERFLNPERVSMPDIDIDVEDTRRDEVIEYIKNKYGKERVAQIVTFGTFKAKAVVKGVARALGISFEESNAITKFIEYDNLIDCWNNTPQLQEIINSKSEYKKMWELSLKLEGLISNIGTHAAGIVISDKNLINYVPLMYQAKNENILTQYDMDTLKEIGLLKIDILGLNTLTIIKDTIKQIKETENIDIDIDKISLDDKKTFQLLQEGNTLGIFQVESSGMQSLIKKAKPTQFSDISILIALYRPGPLRAKMDEMFINRKNKTEPVTYIHNSLKQILAETYGVIVYQEQVMKIAQIIGGFTLGQADIIRRAMATKDPEEMDQQKEIFLKGAEKNKFPKELAEKIFFDIAQFAEYGFNKSHSVSYALLTYQTAYLKANYPYEFMASLLTSAAEKKNDPDKLSQYIQHAKQLNIEIRPPDVNSSDIFFKAVKIDQNKKVILFGLNALKNISSNAVKKIVEEREKNGPYKDIYDFFKRIPSNIFNKKDIESLIKSGAFDSLNVKRRALYENYNLIIKMVEKQENKNQLGLFAEEKFNNINFDNSPEWDLDEKLKYEKEIIGYYFSGHPFDKYKSLIRKNITADISKIKNFSTGEIVKIAGIATKIKIKSNKDDKKIKTCKFILEDKKDSIEVIALGDVYEKFADVIKENEILFIKGNLNKKGNEINFYAKEILPLEEVEKSTTKSVHIKIPYNYLGDENVLNKIKEILINNRGDSEVVLHFVNEKKKILMKPDPVFSVNPTDKFLNQLKNILGENAISLD